MSQHETTRRDAIQGLILAAGGLCANAGPALSQSRETHRNGLWLITKTDYPARLKARLGALEQGWTATDAVLQKSDIREIRDYRDFLDTKARGAKSEAAKLELVNTYVNTHIKRVDDYKLYTAKDVWSPPVNTLTIGGDCEDIALVKYWGLRRLGIAAEDLFLVFGISTFKNPPEGHAVLGVRTQDKQVQVLDILETSVIPANALTHFEPAYAINTVGFWQVDYAERKDGDAWRLQFQLTGTTE